jgi:ABC-2 type transport system permease protein
MSLLLALAKIITRILAFVGREIVEVARRPGALVSLVFGPFLVMAVFGLGYSGYRKPFPTILVVAPSSGLPSDVRTYQDVAGPGLEIIDIVPDAAAADARLESGEVEVVAIAPDDAEERFEAGEQSEIQVRVDISDPIQAAQAGVLADQFANAVNRELIRRAAEQAEAESATLGVPDAGRIPPEVIAAPTRATVANLAPVVPSIVGFFGPAVLALMLQHMAVTLIALSVVRDRTSGVFSLFRVAPVSAFEIVAGKILGFGALAGVIAAASLGLLIAGLGVPMIGSAAALAGVITLLILASLGLGLLISIVSDSERQAVQLALLVLLAAVFFSGFVLPLGEFSTPVRAAAHAIPVTSAIPLIQDIMLRGEIREPWAVGMLAALGGVLTIACWALLRRAMRRS